MGNGKAPLPGNARMFRSVDQNMFSFANTRQFAKLEQNVIVAAFLGRFDYEVVDKHGVKLDQLEPVDDNKATAHKPKIRAFIKFKPKTSTT